MRNLIRTQPIDVIHQPIPISPRFPSAQFSMGIPVVIGPSKRRNGFSRDLSQQPIADQSGCTRFSQEAGIVPDLNWNWRPPPVTSAYGIEYQQFNAARRVS